MISATARIMRKLNMAARLADNPLKCGRARHSAPAELSAIH